MGDIMSIYIPAHFVQSYSTNVTFLLQERGGKLAECVSQGSYTGEMASVVEQVGAVKAKKKTARHSDTPLISTPGDRRWVEPEDWEWADLIDQQDRLRLLIDPTSAYTLNGVNALRRAQDDEILGAFYGSAKTGQKAGTTVTFDTTNNVVGPTVGSTGNSGMNVAKLKRARKLLRKKFVDLEYENVYVCLTAEEEEDLLTETQVINLDYNERPVLIDGRITRFLGIEIKYLEFTATQFYDNATSMLSGTVNYCPVWCKSGMHLGTWNDVVTRVGERPDKSYATQVYVKGTYGATRIEENKVLRIDCDAA